VYGFRSSSPFWPAATQALLLMDIQNGTVDRFAAGDEYLDRVVAAQAKAENAGLLVVLVRVVFNPGHPEISMRNKTFSAFKESDSLLLSTEPHPRLIRGKGEAIVTKKRISAFAGSDLALILRAHNVGHLLVAGIATSGVVLSTVREAADLDYRLTVLADICLDDDDEVHRVLTHKVFPAPSRRHQLVRLAAGRSVSVLRARRKQRLLIPMRGDGKWF
jgi:nicotinamidase-related amidase